MNRRMRRHRDRACHVSITLPTLWIRPPRCTASARSRLPCWSGVPCVARLRRARRRAFRTRAAERFSSRCGVFPASTNALRGSSPSSPPVRHPRRRIRDGRPFAITAELRQASASDAVSRPLSVPNTTSHSPPRPALPERRAGFHVRRASSPRATRCQSSDSISSFAPRLRKLGPKYVAARSRTCCPGTGRQPRCCRSSTRFG